MKRRNFLKIIGAGGVGSGLGYLFGKANKPPTSELIPYLIPPEDIVPGVASWYSSLCTQCNAGCGIIVKTMEGRAKKIEGNPLHPVSKGKVCSRGQASLQALYNPDRIKSPLKRTGDRGKGSYEEISWDEAISILSRNLIALGEKDENDRLHFLTSLTRGSLNRLINDFMTSYGSPNHLQYELIQNKNLLFANNASMGIQTIPHYDIANTKYLLSFGADFASTWLSPVNYSSAYGQMRQGEDGIRGRLIQVEPRLSLTGANADEWVPAKPGTESILALAIAHLIVKEGHYKGADGAAWKALLSEYSPKRAASITDIAEERIHHLAKDFVKTRPSLAIGGESLARYENGVSGLVAVNILNHLAGNIGKKGGVIPNTAEPLTGKSTLESKNSIASLAQAASDSKIKTLLVYNTNPVFTTPNAMKMKESLQKIPFIASFSSFMDETTAMADLILPVHTSLEDWGDDFAEPAVGYPVATIMQPAVSPTLNTMGIGDIILSLAKGVGGKVKDKLPWNGFSDYLKDAWKDSYSKNKAMSASALTFDGFWNELLARGGWWPSERANGKAVAVSPNAVESHISKTPSHFEGNESEYPLYLTTYPHSHYLDGRGANLPWLQEMPDPMTSVVWGSWIEVNPKTAAKMGIKEGDTVTVESPYGKIKAHAYLAPGIRPDTVSMPIGQGHASYGRYAKDRGSNPIEILPFKKDANTLELALNSTRVRLSRTASSDKMVKIEGSTRELGRNIVQTISPDKFNKMNKETA
ncbi:MAG: molybdopterin-dependent oxidoreductase [Proteobacteria bacterium]|nr:molybdopterin-dependent oxidoreductase [Pseudomonadota bacterium]